MKVTIGETDVTPGTAQNTWASTRNVVYAKMWKRHESFNGATGANNIGLVYLPADVYYSSNSQIMNLYLKDPEISGNAATYYMGQSVKIAGWGMTGDYPAAVSNTLKYITIPIVTESDCGYTLGEYLVG
jgi:hypothetical protein